MRAEELSLSLTGFSTLGSTVELALRQRYKRASPEGVRMEERALTLLAFALDELARVVLENSP